ncbi:hypothetical protein [Paenibacillus radicis (ex Gao et al. 2016)]|uniref:Uncharacterized protein n=1 Tax=Paenibacillus radicis (ex Gao et al. 2016) TaxID=1737354 RepID=A0A917LZ38_9BACL|nr:hypothetical protein [Paenibacillus radicis (ex Gao et al. 2016)]GGG67276.1 hypothetical protein GCM10010918_22360 [Paenibacillus radicis (ex Gao et al. 2016)]
MDVEKIRVNLECPDCPGSEIKIAHSLQEGGIYTQRIALKGKLITSHFQSERILFICSRCGWILREYAEKPEKL